MSATKPSREATEAHQSLRYDALRDRVTVIDQTRLPHEFLERELVSLEDACESISAMWVRGAPLIGVTAAFGVYLALRSHASGGGVERGTAAQLEDAIERLAATRPTAINLRWALNRVGSHLRAVADAERVDESLAIARALHAEDIAACAALGEHGADLLEDCWRNKCREAEAFGGSVPERLNVLTHCNAGSLATVDWGTALAVIYKAQARGLPVHVWVDETRPRNQGAALSCWELARRGVEHTLIVDNAGGHLMQHGLVDCCVVGSDRTTLNGDVCNKIGTYGVAISARHHNIPFHVVAPLSTVDPALPSGDLIPIEERPAEEITEGFGHRTAPRDVEVYAPAFDVTPAALVTSIITEVGIIESPDTAKMERALRDGGVSF